MARKAFNGWQLKLYDFYFSNSACIGLFLALENLNLGYWMQVKHNVILRFTQKYHTQTCTMMLFHRRLFQIRRFEAFFKVFCLFLPLSSLFLPQIWLKTCWDRILIFGVHSCQLDSIFCLKKCQNQWFETFEQHKYA